jgi:ATP-dependent helicase/DNAse subunit B
MSTQSAEREFFYEAITRARHKLLLTRPVLADNGAEWVASPFWEAVRHLVEVEPESIPSETAVPLGNTASQAEWWETLASYPDSMIGQQIQNRREWQSIQSAAQIWQMRQAGETAVWEGDLTTLAPELSAQFGPDHIWSASRLESYQVCGFLFYLQNILKVEPRPEPTEGLDGRQLGRVYHDIFEQVTESEPPKELEETAVYDWITAIANPVLDSGPEQEGFRETAWWSQTRMEIINNVVRTILNLSADAYEFHQAEAAFGINGPPLMIRGRMPPRMKCRSAPSWGSRHLASGGWKRYEE